MVSLCLLLVQSRIVNYEIFRDDKKVGTAKIAIKITQDGGKRADSKIQLQLNGKTLDMHSTQVWAFSGKPTLKINQIFDDKGVEVDRNRMDFKATEVVITHTVKDKPSKKSVPIDPKAEIRDFGEFWFIRDEPIQGKAVKYMMFDSSAQAWQSTTTTYQGSETKSIGGKSMKVHHVSQQIGQRKLEIWLDDGGIPMLTESSDHTRIVATI